MLAERKDIAQWRSESISAKLFFKLTQAKRAFSKEERWDGASVHECCGVYGDDLLSKVAQVFPALGRRVLQQLFIDLCNLCLGLGGEF